MNAALRRLEEKIAYLERHVTAQDKAMLELSREIEALRRELKALRERAATRAAGEGDAAEKEERPPHY